MARLHDSPLNEPIPPPAKFKLPSVRTCGWVGSAIIGVIVVAGAIAPLFLRQSKCRDWGPPEVNNLRQIRLAYLSGLALEGNPSRPLVVAPLVPGTARFDPRPFKGKAIILRMDNSVSSLKIDKDGRVLIAGENILDPKNPIWDGHPPVIVWPDLDIESK